jgi:hypothetical protein
MIQPLTSDTAPEAQQVRIELMRKLPVWKRIELTCELIQTLRKLMLADLRRRFPNADEEELTRRLISRLLSRDDVMRAYHFDPVAEGYQRF